MKYYFEGVERLDWGFGNPNITAAFIVQLMMLCWLPAFLPWGKSKKLGFSIGFIVSILLVYHFGDLLMQTYSRGGVVAAIVAHIFLGIFALFRVATRTLVVSGVVISLLVTQLYLRSVELNFNKRFDQVVAAGKEKVDRGTKSRWIMYQRLPSMLFDAPEGWGNSKEKVAEAYCIYYQPFDRSDLYQNLLSGHFTKLTQWNWIQRVMYLMAWVIALIISCPILNDITIFFRKIFRWVLWQVTRLLGKKITWLKKIKERLETCKEADITTEHEKGRESNEEKSSNPPKKWTLEWRFKGAPKAKTFFWKGAIFACVMSLAVADLFSDASDQTVVYHPTFCALIVLGVAYLWQRALPLLNIIIYGILAMLLFFSVLFYFHVDYKKETMFVCYKNGCVRLGKEPKLWIVNPRAEKSIFDNWGKSARIDDLSCCFYDSWENVPMEVPEGVKLVVAGDQSREIEAINKRKGDLVLLNPKVSPSEFIENIIPEQHGAIKIMWGSFFSQPGRYTWKSKAKEEKYSFYQMTGVAEYVESFSIIVEEAK